jgi:peptidoglycan lytic transglycosylase D
MGPVGRHALQTVFLIWAVLSLPTRPAVATIDGSANPHFPKPAALQPNVEFWKQIYTDYGVADFVLHDRENLGITYAVVRVEGTSNECRAAAIAKPEIQRHRDKYADILERLSQGVAPGELGAEGVRVAQAWGCPCSPEALRRAAGNIRVQQGLRERVQEGMQRARGLLPQILSILRRYNVPEELAALPMVESTFNPHARSKAGAVGLWQFIKSTGKRYLTIKGRRDDRRDPIRASEAAARLLKHNYEALGSWPLAITAYNHGQEGILAARTAVGSSAIEEIVEHYTGPRFGFASRNFYAEFLAALELFQPYLTAHARPVEATSLQRAAQKISVTAKRPPALATMPPTPPTPSGIPPSAEASLPATAAPSPSPQSQPVAEPGSQPSAPADAASLPPTIVPEGPSAPEPGVETQQAVRPDPVIP